VPFKNSPAIHAQTKHSVGPFIANIDREFQMLLMMLVMMLVMVFAVPDHMAMPGAQDSAPAQERSASNAPHALPAQQIEVSADR
jgi:hypothetical protein